MQTLNKALDKTLDKTLTIGVNVWRCQFFRYPAFSWAGAESVDGSELRVGWEWAGNGFDCVIWRRDLAVGTALMRLLLLLSTGCVTLIFYETCETFLTKLVFNS